MRRWWMGALAGWLLAAPGVALAQGKTESGRPDRGTLISAQPGDIACYLRIRDDGGRSQSWMADFELCERAGPRIGRRFALTWQAGTVQHPSCQGSPDCRRSQQIMLLVGMTPLAR